MKTRNAGMKSRPGWSNHRNAYGTLGFFITLIVFTLRLPVLANATLLSSESDGSLIELTFETGDYTLADVTVNGEQCTRIEPRDASQFAVTLTKGLPQLPYLTESVAIPGAAAMGLEIVSRTVKELRVNTIVPSKGSLKRSVNPAAVPYTFGSFYSRDEWYPSQTVTLGEPYIINAVRGQVVTCYPFQYNPKSGILRVTTSIVVRVKRTGTSAVNTLSTRSRTIAPAFENLYTRHFINFERVRPLYTFIPDGDKMIVIAPSSLRSAVQPLVDWKNQKGIAATVYEYPAQTGGSGTAKLAEFIRSKYTSEKIAYVLLVGDNTAVPSTKYDDQGEDALSDVTYTEVNGSDNYPDVFIGRLCSSKSSEITALVDKTVKYEKSPDPAMDWYQKALGIGSDEQQESTQKDYEWMEEFRTKHLEPYGYTTVDKIYDPDADKAALIAAINQGRSWINYMGHGSTDMFGTTEFGVSDVASLTNKDMPPIITVVACFVGKFDEQCLAATMTNAANRGALAFMGSYVGQDWVEPQWGMTEMVEELLTKDKCLSVGGIFYNGECKMLEKGSTSERDYKTWTYFGDPSVMHFTKKLKPLAVTAPASVGKGNQQVKVTLSEAVTGRVALFDPVGKKLLGSTMLTAAGTSATVSATIPDNAASVTLTVTAFNRVPAISAIKVGTTGISENPAGEPAVSLTLRRGKSAAYFTVTGPSAMRKELKVFDTRGRLLYAQSGERIGAWRYENDRGARIARGTYFAVVKCYDHDRIALSRTFKLGVD